MAHQRAIFLWRPLDWNRVEGNWKEMKGKVKEKWGKLTDDDLTAIDGRRDPLEGVLPAGSPCRRRDAQASARRTDGRSATLSMDSRASISRSNTAASCRSSSDINLKLASSLKWGISARTACFSFKFS